MAKLAGVSGKIQRSAAEIFAIADHIPQNFADAHDSHTEILCTGLDYRIVLR